MNRSAVCVVMLLMAVSGSPFLSAEKAATESAQDSSSDVRDTSNQSSDDDSRETETDNHSVSGEQNRTRPRFDPSEEISKDLSVSFPVDI